MSILTPAFVFDTDKLSEQIAYIRMTFGAKHKLCYAMKANPFLVGALVDSVDCFEVCSPGEYRICERLNVPREKIVLSGVYKEPADIRRIVCQCGAKTTYTVESPAQLKLLSEIAEETKGKLPVILRLSSGNQFGVDKETLADMVASRNAVSVDIVGIQYYSGTQKKTDKILKEIEEISRFAAELKEKYGYSVRRIEYGPGLKINYFTGESDEAGDHARVADALNAWKDYETVLEMGRFIAAPCGEYHTQIADIKRTCGVNFCIVDGGMHHLNYYGQMMAMKQPYITHRAEGEEEAYTICGSLCTTADVLVKNYVLKGARVGDTLIFHNTGAYTITEGIYLFLSRDMPRVYLRSAGTPTLVRDVIQTDKINSMK